MEAPPWPSPKGEGNRDGVISEYRYFVITELRDAGISGLWELGGKSETFAYGKSY